MSEITLSQEECEELWEFMSHSYFDPNKWKHLPGLLERVAKEAGMVPIPTYVFGQGQD